MAYNTEIPWGDGTSDKIYFSAAASEGDQTVAVSSDANAGYVERTKDITFTVVAGQTTITKTLTVKQTGKDFLVITFNDTAITHNNTAVGYEQ